jgi:hypothetical protein
MQTRGTGGHVYVALVLAVVAAIASFPWPSDPSEPAWTQWLPNAYPEAGTFAAAVGEPPEMGVPP